jgi:hypothetical protein
MASKVRYLKNDPAAQAAAMASLAAAPPTINHKKNSGKTESQPVADLRSHDLRKQLAREATKLTGLKQVTARTPITPNQANLKTAQSLRSTKRRHRRRPA